MDNWKIYVISIFACSLICSLISGLVVDTCHRRLIELICGVVLIMAVLQPVSTISWRDFGNLWRISELSADTYVDLGVTAARREQERHIKEACEAYILERAEEMDIRMAVEVLLNNEMIPKSVQIMGISGDERQQDMEIILETELGVTKENQEWIWNLEDNSS